MRGGDEHAFGGDNEAKGGHTNHFMGEKAHVLAWEPVHAGLVERCSRREPGVRKAMRRHSQAGPGEWTSTRGRIARSDETSKGRPSFHHDVPVMVR